MLSWPRSRCAPCPCRPRAFKPKTDRIAVSTSYVLCFVFVDETRCFYAYRTWSDRVRRRDDLLPWSCKKPCRRNFVRSLTDAVCLRNEIDVAVPLSRAIRSNHTRLAVPKTKSDRVRPTYRKTGKIFGVSRRLRDDGPRARAEANPSSSSSSSVLISYENGHARLSQSRRYRQIFMGNMLFWFVSVTFLSRGISGQNTNAIPVHEFTSFENERQTARFPDSLAVRQLSVLLYLGLPVTVYIVLT